jgi:hypothetical protein
VGIHPKETKSTCQRDNFLSMFIEELFTTAKIWDQSKSPSMDEWMRKL